MSFQSYLNGLKTKIQTRLSAINSSLTAKGATAVTDLSEVPEAIDSISGGTPLPVLNNPAMPNNVLTGKEYIDGNGEKQTGTLESGDKWQRPTEWLPKPNDYTDPTFDGLYFLIDNTSKNAWFATTISTTGTDAIRYRVEWGITDENGEFTADGYEDVSVTSPLTPFATTVPPTYEYVWYRVTSPQRQLNGFASQTQLPCTVWY